MQKLTDRTTTECLAHGRCSKIVAVSIELWKLAILNSFIDLPNMYGSHDKPGSWAEGLGSAGCCLALGVSPVCGRYRCVHQRDEGAAQAHITEELT